MSKQYQAVHIFFAACVLVFSASGQGFLTDQRNDPAVPPNILRYWTLFGPGATPLGQEFTPSLESLSFVDLMTHDGGSQTATLEVRIHHGAITNPVIAVSNPTVRNEEGESVVHFEFPCIVPLVPGERYVIEVALLDGGGGIGASPSGGYAGGQMIRGGQPLPPPYEDDLWFREGVVPEPHSLSLALIGAGSVLFARISRRLKRAR